MEEAITFPFYPGNIKITIPLGEITLEQFIKGNMDPKDNIKNIFKQIEEATRKGDIKLKAELKQKNLFFFTPSVKTDGLGRSYSNIIDWNELIVLDFDGLLPEEAVELRAHLFNDFKSCVASWISPSNHGVKALFRIPKPTSVDDFKTIGCGLGHIFEWYKGFDSSSITNPILPLFLSWDPNMLVRDFNLTVPFTLRGYKETLFEPFEGELPDSDSFSPEEIQKVVEAVKFFINRIEGNGHPAVCKASILTGSLSTYYGVDLLPTLEEAIINNNYLSKGTDGYIRTARQMYEKGTHNPQKLKYE